MEHYEEDVRGLVRFLADSPTAFHAVEGFARMLEERGYRELPEREHWDIRPGGNYYTVRNGSSIAAFQVGSTLEDYSFKVAASHSDSPTFKLKEKAELEVRGHYTQLNTEGYGSILCSTWMDRPLSVAGRAIVRKDGGFRERLVRIDRDMVLIPSVAIHMDRNVNEKSAFNKQVDMLPLFAGGADDVQGAVRRIAAEELGVREEEIFGMDLYLYNRMQPSVWGKDGEFLSAPRLDDLQCAYTSFAGFLRGADDRAVNVFACFDNEEVGSNTKQGAGSTFLKDVLERINEGLGKTREELRRALASSFLVSCDNSHAVHPNHPEKTDQSNCVYMNEGIVIKSHAGQQYTSDAFSIAVWRGVCERAGVPVQFFANRSDMRGGSTLGNIAMSQVSMNAVDIGLAQLAMHSSYETAGVRDSEYMIRAVKAFFDSGICEYTLGR